MFQIQNQINISPCFHLDYLENLKGKIYFKKKTNKNNNSGFGTKKLLKIYINRNKWYSIESLNYKFYEFKWLNIFKFSIASLFMGTNWCNNFPKKSKKIGKALKIIQFSFLYDICIKIFSKFIETYPQSRKVVLSCIFKSYFEQNVILNFQKIRFLENLKEIDGLLLSDISLHRQSYESIFLKLSKVNTTTESNFQKLKDFFRCKVYEFDSKIISNIIIFLHSNIFGSILVPIFLNLSNTDPWNSFEGKGKDFLLIDKEQLEYMLLNSIQTFIFKHLFKNIKFFEKFPSSPISGVYKFRLETRSTAFFRYQSDIFIYEKSIENFHIKILSSIYNPFWLDFLSYISIRLNKKKLPKIKNSFILTFEKIHLDTKWKNEKFSPNFFKILNWTPLNFGNGCKADIEPFIDSLFYSSLILKKMSIQCFIYFQGRNILKNRQDIKKCLHILFGCQQNYRIFLFF